MQVAINELRRRAVGATHPVSLESVELLGDQPVSGLVGSLTLTLLDDISVLAQGSVTVAVPQQCGRCLRHYDHQVAVDFAEHFTDQPDDEQWPIENEVIDLTEPLRTTILLAVPDQPIHSPDCAGLCPACGKDLNDEPHQHQTDPPADEGDDNPFAVLKDRLN